MIINKEAYLLNDIPQFHPSSEEYLLFWREEKKRCIEGHWVGGSMDAWQLILLCKLLDNTFK